MSDTFQLRDFIEKFTLPQLVKVHEGFYDKHQRSTVSADALYRLLSLESIETVLIEDAVGEEDRIPIDYPCAVERVAEERFQQQQLGIPDLLHDNYPDLKFVRVIESDPNYETLVKAGDKLKLDLKKRKTGEDYLPLKNVKDKGKTLWKLPASCNVKFQALLDGEELPLAKFVKKNKLPAYVCFIVGNKEDSIDEDKDISLPTGVVKLKGTVVESFVMATTEDQDVKAKCTFPLTLPISVEAVKKDFLKSPLEESESYTTMVSEEYEDMSGYLAKTDFNAPVLKTPPGRMKEKSADRPLALSDYEMSGTRVLKGNTYSPPPSMKEARSNSLLGQGKGRSLLKRAMSNMELRTNTTETEEHVYDDLDFNYLNTEKLKCSSLSQTQRRRSDSNTDQVSKQNLNNLLQVHAQSLEGEDFQGKIETVSLQIRRKSPVYSETSKTMNTFGRKGTTARETESVRSDVSTLDSILENQSYFPNTFIQSRSVTTNSPFYGSDETDHEAEPNKLPATPKRRSSDDALPSLPKSQERCKKLGEAKGKRSLPGGKSQGLPINVSQGRDTDANQNSKQASQMPSCSVIAKDISITERVSPGFQCQEDPPPPIPSRRNKQRGCSICPVSSPTLEINVLSNKDSQPAPPSREKSRSFHGTEQAKQPMISSPDRKAKPVAKPRSLSASSQQRCNSPSSCQKQSWASPSFSDNSVSPGTQVMRVSEEKPQTFTSEIAESKFTIPEDLSNLKVVEVLQCLQKLNMQQFEEIFNERQVDGSMLVCLDEEALESFGMDRFYRLKLLRFIAGWRPQL